MSWLQGQVVGTGGPSANPAGSNPIVPAGPHGEAMFAEFHGKWYHAARAGRIWISAPLIAGVTIPVNTATAATFALYNPVASGVNLELIHFTFGTAAAAALVVSQILASIAKTTPTTVTLVDNVLNPMSAGLPAGQLYKTATIGAAMTTHIPLTTAFSTASMTAVQYEFDGKVILPPGWTMQITSSPVQTNASIPSLCWAEWPQ